MGNIYILLALNGIFFTKASAFFAAVEDFRLSELANLTLQQKHRLMLQKVATKDESVIASAFYHELLSMNIGNYFFGFAKDESTARANNAIVKAAFGCLQNLLIQDRVDQLLVNVSTNGAAYAKTFKDVSFAFSLACADLDSSLANETQYTILRDKFKQQPYALPKEVYHYGIAESNTDEMYAIANLTQEPALKFSLAQQLWIHVKDSEDSRLKDIQQAVLALAKVSDKSEEVQQLYDRTIDEILPLIRTTGRVYPGRPWKRHTQFDNLQPILTENIWSKIVENIPNWTDYLECNPISDEDVTDSSLSNSKQGRNHRCGKVKIKPGSEVISNNAWPVTSDFDPILLSNMTLEQKHELLIEELAKKHVRLIENVMTLEIFAKSIGNDFFGFVKDETANVRNNAICRAVVECSSHLRLQPDIGKVIRHFTRIESEYVKETGDIVEGFNRVCSAMDEYITNNTTDDGYSLLRDKYIQENVTSSKITYQYSLGEPTDNQREIIAQLFNTQQIKKYFFHNFWMLEDHSDPPWFVRTKFITHKLANVHIRAEAIQKIYEQSVDEAAGLYKGFPSDIIFDSANTAQMRLLDARKRHILEAQAFITRRIWFKMKKYPRRAFLASLYYIIDGSNKV